MPCDFSVDMVRESGDEPMWYAPVPQESMEEMRGCGVGVSKEVRERKTPSDIVERPVERVSKEEEGVKVGIGTDRCFLGRRRGQRRVRGRGRWSRPLCLFLWWARCVVRVVVVEYGREATVGGFVNIGRGLCRLEI